jgi:ribosomal protein S18 acetylase RimI-like enzyme
VDNGGVIRRGTWDDLDAAVALSGEGADVLRWRWEVPSFDPARHLWLAENGDRALAFGALYAPDVACVRGDAAQIGTLLERIEAQAREEGLPHIAFVIPEWDEPAWRAYEAAGFAATTAVLQLEVVLDAPPPAPSAAVPVRTYTDDDAAPVRTLLDEAYLGWDDTYEPMAHDDWLAFMTQHDSFDPACWFLAEEAGTLLGVCLCWKEGWVKDIAVAEGARGRGVGEALLRHALAALYARGVRRVGLKVDAFNPTGAIRLYERVGMSTVKRFRTYVKKL